MAKDSSCAICNAERPDFQGVCTECDGCFGDHCDCVVCAHDKPRADECVFCQRVAPQLLDALVQADDIDADLRWLMGDSNV